MKQILFLLLLVPIIAYSETGKINASIYPGVSVKAGNQLNFSTLTTIGACTVTISPTGILTSTGDVSFSGETQGAGIFSLQGQNDANVVLLLPTTSEISNGTTTIECSFFMSNLVGNRGTLSATGTLTIKIGCTLTIPANVTAGAFTGEIEVTASYD